MRFFDLLLIASRPASATSGGGATPYSGVLLLSGDMQSGTDKLLLSGDMQTGTDHLTLSGNV